MASNIGDFRGKVGSRIRDDANKLKTNGPLATPSAPAVSNQGAAGGTSYSYRIVARSASGTTVPGPAGTTATGNSTLNGSNFNRVTWAAVAGAVSYDVYGRTSPEQLIANVTATTYDDQGAVTPNGTQPGIDTSAGDIDKAILNAVEEYSKQRPLEKTAKVAGTGGFDYALTGGSPVLPGFVDGFSTVNAVAYPYLTTDQRLKQLEEDDYDVVRLDTGIVFRFWQYKPQTGEFFLAVFTVPHTVSVATSTVPSSDDEALADLAAAYACETLASLYSQSTDNTWGADSVAHITKAGEYSRRAKEFRGSFQEKMDAGTSEAAASALTEIDINFGNRYSEDRFFHGRVRF